jgi:AcrR family transcriptional regulator
MPKPAKTSRAEIRVAAFRCFRDHGFHSTTVDRICQEAGISKGSFYYWFDSKQAVFADILSTWIDVVGDEVRDQFAEVLATSYDVSDVADAIVREIHRGRAIMPIWLEFFAAARTDPVIREAMAEFFLRIRQTIAEVLRPSLGTRMTEEELMAVSAAIFGGFSGLVIQDLLDSTGSDATDTVRVFMTALPRWLKVDA